MKVAGDTWDVTREDQFGSGGRMPERFARAGRLAPAGDVAIVSVRPTPAGIAVTTSPTSARSRVAWMASTCAMRL